MRPIRPTRMAASDAANLYYWSNLAADYDNLEFLNGLAGNHSAQTAYAAKRQDALARAQPKPGTAAAAQTLGPWYGGGVPFQGSARCKTIRTAATIQCTAGKR